MDADAELGRNPLSKHRIQPEHGDEEADAGRARDQILRRKRRQGKFDFPYSADHEQNSQPLFDYCTVPMRMSLIFVLCCINLELVGRSARTYS